MSKKAFVVITGSRQETGAPTIVGGSLQQETRVYEGDDCVCTVLVIFPAGSPEWERYHAGGRALDGMPPVRNHSIQSDVVTP
jgi:hypothetical protein